MILGKIFSIISIFWCQADIFRSHYEYEYPYTKDKYEQKPLDEYRDSEYSDEFSDQIVYNDKPRYQRRHETILWSVLPPTLSYLALMLFIGVVYMLQRQRRRRHANKLDVLAALVESDHSELL